MRRVPVLAERNAMRRAQRLPELLAPAGDMDALIAAVLAGADAVYVGGRRFGARAFAKNFELSELAMAVRLCHLHGVRLYVTVNTLIYDKELSDAVEYAAELYRIGVDAIIVADLGVASAIRKALPYMELHASTQMGIHNAAGANIAAELGCTRIVAARECSKEDIDAIIENSIPECEVFVHGALCVCHSGQCLFSSLVGGRSGNRGECAQPCRLPYGNGSYTLSLSDLSLAKHIKELIASGVASLKIEGRMKSPDYVYGVTRIFRRLLDEGRDATDIEMSELMRIFSRGKFTDGYYTGRLAKGMTGIRREEDKRASHEAASAVPGLPKVRVFAEAEFKEGEAARLTLSAYPRSVWDERGEKSSTPHNVGPIRVTVLADAPQRAINAPLTVEGLRARLMKMGNTPFSIAEADVRIVLGENINLSPAKINELRREACLKLEESFALPIKRLMANEGQYNLATKDCTRAEFSKGKSAEGMPLNTAVFYKANVFSELVQAKRCELEFFDIIFLPLFDYSKLCNSERASARGVYIPPVIMDSEWQEVRDALAEAKRLGAEYALIGNISHVVLCKEVNIRPVGDIRLNVTNHISKELYRKLGVEDIILSAELTLPQARDIGGGEVVLGRIPLMLTERCFIKDSFGCEKCGKARLTDRRGAAFPMLREYRHRNLIFNSTLTYMGDRAAELDSFGIAHRHFIFSSESAEECLRLISNYRNGVALNIDVRRIGKR